ncbi:hypothetical protein BJ508DRAFT_380616 [Ascobolus immersus RN42]|uniref:Uncharacterized protein n=1 Tax=Ascobolus immersus RN42 TaxID=1160509 RepID=A0A3N4HKL8_ASCIM|nr:hypothetical protein BJ508DRAFT_380616 [Ascobolus immersus RN42]
MSSTTLPILLRRVSSIEVNTTITTDGAAALIQSSSGKPPAPAVLGGAIGGVLGWLLIISLVVGFFMWKKRKREMMERQGGFEESELEEGTGGGKGKQAVAKDPAVLRDAEWLGLDGKRLVELHVDQKGCGPGVDRLK